MPSVASVVTFSSLWLACMTCCFCWPTEYRRSYQYFPPMMEDLPSVNQWDIAQEPLSYEQPEDYYDNSQWADVEALSNLIEMYDNPQPPIWGQIVREKPEEELEELKRSAPHKRPSLPQGRVTMSPPHSHSASSSPSTSSSYQTSTIAPALNNNNNNNKGTQVNQVKPVQVFQRGQKEVPLLRPPKTNKAMQHAAAAASALASNGEEDGVVSAKLNSSERQKKPSAYDTLRKYLSLEDALEKEKRRSHTQPQKRSKNFVAEEGSLTGQLSNLKKSVL